MSDRPPAPLNNPDVNPFAGLDVPALLRIRAETRVDHPFLIWEPFDGDTEIFSYAAFNDRVERVAAGLKSRGVRPGEFVLIHLDNCPETVIAWYACARLGAVAVTTNARSAGSELAYFADHCGAVAAITQPAFAELVAKNCGRVKWIAVTETDSGVAPEPGRGPDRASSFDSLTGDPADLPARRPDPLAPVCVQYTSGTTSRP